MVAIAASLLSGCAPETATDPTVTARPDVTASTRPSTATPTPTAPALVPDGSAADNLPAFTAVMDQVWASDDKVKGRAYIDALIDAGFDKSDMQVTNDETSVGNAADSIEFAVLWGQECLVGQVGPSTKTPTAVVLPELPDGGCLIGTTRPIDW